MGWPPAPAGLPTAVDPSWPRLLYPFGTPEAVSTERPLLALAEFGRQYRDMVFTVRNHDAANRIVFYVDHSQSGVVVSPTRDVMGVAPLHEESLPIRDGLQLFYSLSACGDPDGGFPSCMVSWSIVGRRREYR